MVEVFKTDVEKQSQANLLTAMISLAFAGYQATFDLEDCDKVLRISCPEDEISCTAVIKLLENFGYQAAILEEFFADPLYNSIAELNAY